MWGAIIFGSIIGMAAYIAMGGTNYALMTVIVFLASLCGVYIAERLAR